MIVKGYKVTFIGNTATAYMQEYTRWQAIKTGLLLILAAARGGVVVMKFDLEKEKDE